MDMKIGAFLALLFVYLRIQTVSSLKCHVCSSVNPGQEDCAEVKPSDTKYLVSCSGPANASCRVQDQWVEFEILRQQHDKRTIRQCATTPFDATRPCYYRAGFGGKVNVCNCVGDGCNGAAALTSALATIGATFAALLLLRFV